MVFVLTFGKYPCKLQNVYPMWGRTKILYMVIKPMIPFIPLKSIFIDILSSM